MMRKFRLWILRARYNRKLTQIRAGYTGMDPERFMTIQIEALALLQQINHLTIDRSAAIADRRAYRDVVRGK